MTKNFCSIRQFAAEYGVPECALRRMYRNDQLPGFASGKAFHINVKALCEFLDIEPHCDDTEAN